MLSIWPGWRLLQAALAALGYALLAVTSDINELDTGSQPGRTISKYPRPSSSSNVLNNRQTSASCYYLDASPAPEDTPCGGSGDAQACCPSNWQCVNNGLCYFPKFGYYGRFTCTDPTWVSQSCPHICTSSDTFSYEAIDNTIHDGEAILQCDFGSYCCDGNRSLPGCCESGSERFSLEPLPVLARMAGVTANISFNIFTATATMSVPPSASSTGIVANALPEVTTQCFSDPEPSQTPSCFTLASKSQANLLELTILDGNLEDCIDPSYMLLWFLFYNIFTVVTGLTLRSAKSRTFLAHLVGRNGDQRSLSDPGTLKEQALDFYDSAFFVFSSFILQVGATVGTAFILTRDSPSASVWHIFALWAARPLATSIVIYLVMINPYEYAFQAVEITWVDTLLSVVSLLGFGTVAQATVHRESHPTPVDASKANIAQAGSAVGIISIILLLHLLYKIHPGYIFVHTWQGEDGELKADWRRLNPSRLKFVGAWAFVLHSLRYIACWLLWAGVLQTNHQAFCPSVGALFEVMGLWLLVPILENLLRVLIVGQRRQELADEDHAGAEGTFRAKDVMMNLLDLNSFRTG